MEAKSSALRCPHCGARDFDLINDDIFLCRYRHEKFNFVLDEIVKSDENKIFFDELKQEFRKKIFTLDEEKSRYRALLVRCCEKMNFVKVETIVFGLLGVLIMVLAAGFANVFTIIATAISAAACVCTVLYKRKRHKKYQPIATYYAKMAADCEEQIKVYSRLLSKLDG